jgi:hypothetical protein
LIHRHCFRWDGKDAFMYARDDFADTSFDSWTRRE